MNIFDRTNALLHELVTFKLAYDVSCYLADRARADWRSFEMEQHEEYPIRGCGVIATPALIKEWSRENETLLHLDEDLAPENTGSEIDSFPRNAVSTTYVYSLLEAYGHEMCDLRNQGYRKERQAWHHGVYGDEDAVLGDEAFFEKMENNFRKPFAIEGQVVPRNIVTALVGLKRERNRIVHEMEHTCDFELSFRYVVAIACCIYTLCDTSKRPLKVYPWEDYHGKYAP
ncbi:MAG: hypothetical protein HY941_06600 [Gammaproteobacteria bacterium]|nr:hypothetical protein [Gammaproteobacteria bacterium]